MEKLDSISRKNKELSKKEKNNRKDRLLEE